MTRIEFEKMISGPLKEMEFIKKRGWFIKYLDENSIGRIGFNVAQYGGGHTHISPYIGIRYIPIEKILEKIVKEKNDTNPYSTTINLLIGYTMPDEFPVWWKYSKTSNVENITENMLEAIKSYGLPFMQKYTDIYEIKKYFENRKGSTLYGLPVLYFLLGDKQKGIDYILDVIERKKQPIPHEEIERRKQEKLSGLKIMRKSLERKKQPKEPDKVALNRIIEIENTIANSESQLSKLDYSSTLEGKKYLSFLEKFKSL